MLPKREKSSFEVKMSVNMTLSWTRYYHKVKDWEQLMFISTPTQPIHIKHCHQNQKKISRSSIIRDWTFLWWSKPNSLISTDCRWFKLFILMGVLSLLSMWHPQYQHTENTNTKYILWTQYKRAKTSSEGHKYDFLIKKKKKVCFYVCNWK